MNEVYVKEIITQERPFFKESIHCPFCSESAKVMEIYSYQTRLLNMERLYKEWKKNRHSRVIVVQNMIKARTQEKIAELEEKTKKYKKTIIKCETCGLEIDKGEKVKRTNLMKFLVNYLPNPIIHKPPIIRGCGTGLVEMRQRKIIEGIGAYLKQSKIDEKAYTTNLFFLRKISLKKLLILFENTHEKTYLKRYLEYPPYLKILNDVVIKKK